LRGNSALYVDTRPVSTSIVYCMLSDTARVEMYDLRETGILTGLHSHSSPQYYYSQ